MGPMLSSAMNALSIFVPNKYVFIVATGVGWYGRQLTLTYGHDLTRKFVIARTVKVIGYERVGNFLGSYVVAPLSVPQVVSNLAKGVGVLAGLITILVLNILCYCYGKWGEWRPPDPKPTDPPPPEKYEKAENTTST